MSMQRHTGQHSWPTILETKTLKSPSFDFISNMYLKTNTHWKETHKEPQTCQ